MLLVILVTVGYNSAAYVMQVVAGRGSDRLERCVRVAEVGGSNPLAPTRKKAVCLIDYRLFGSSSSHRVEFHSV